MRLACGGVAMFALSMRESRSLENADVGDLIGCVLCLREARSEGGR